MKIAFINGSPKTKRNTSGIMLQNLRFFLEEHEACSSNMEIIEIGLHTASVSDSDMNTLKDADACVISCPLYIDALPGHLLSCLMQIEKSGLQNPALRVYGIVNCGFYEGIQADIALEIIQHWCAACSFLWSGGLGIGGGGGLSFMPPIKAGTGPLVKIGRALRSLAAVILKGSSQDNTYETLTFPRFLYKLAAEHGWRKIIKANGGKVKDLGRCR
ncbi:MAG: hypothetical protein K5930_05485 [Treponemataceae bacterium]|nr:hypothetical protein [Treponemataceae bacterium]